MVIDSFSKYGWIEALKSMKGADVATVVDKIFKSGRNQNIRGQSQRMRVLKQKI